MKTKLYATFREGFCDACEVPPEDFVEALWLQATYPHARILRFILNKLHPGYFEPEEYLLKRVGDCRDVAAIQTEVDLYHAKVIDSSFMKGPLRMRVRCRDLTKLGRRWLPSRLYTS